MLFFILKAAPAEEHAALRLEAASGGGAAYSQAGESPSWLAEYSAWLGNASLGDFGVSRALQKGRPASELLWPAGARSLSLLLTGLALLTVLGLTLAVARHHYAHVHAWSGVEALVSLASTIPIFLFVYVGVAGGNRLIDHGVAQGWWGAPEWFPLPFRDDWFPWLCAALILALGDGALMDLLQRFRGELTHAAGGEYVTGSRAMGLSFPLLVLRGFLPGAVSHLSRRISFLLGSMVILEAALGWPGIGYLAWRAAAERDMPVLLGAALVMALALRVAHMGAELVGYIADPRRRGAT